MPTPVPEALDAHATLARAKADLVHRSLPRFLLLAAMAGAYVGVAVVLLVMASAAFVVGKDPAAKLVQGAVFGVALTLVVFAGAELVTGNVMIALQGLLRRSVTAVEAVLLVAASLVGNLLGSLAFAALVNAAGTLSVGAAPGKPTAFQQTLASIVAAKAALSGGQLFFRSVLCNLLVCLALWMATRAASDAAKLICLWWALLAFVASGFEHSVANMTVLALGIFGHTAHATWGELARNLAWTVPGNLVGGGLLVGVAYGWAGDRSPAATTEPVATAPSAVEPTVAGPAEVALAARLDEPGSLAADPVAKAGRRRPVAAARSARTPADA